MTCCPPFSLGQCHRGMRSSGTGCPSVQHNSTCKHVTADTALSSAVADSLCPSFFPSFLFPLLACCCCCCRSPTMAPQLRCKCIWALACLAYSPTPAWLSQLAESAFPPQDVTKMTPGELTDALWGLYTLQNRPQQEEAGASPASAAHPAPAAAASTPASTPSASSTRGSSSSLLTMQHMAALDRKLYKRVHELQPPQVLRLLELAEGAAEAVPGYRLPSGVGEQMSATLSARATAISDTAGVLKLAWAAASLALPLHGSAKEHICRKLYSQLGVLSASDMARGFWASAKLRYGCVLVGCFSGGLGIGYGGGLEGKGNGALKRWFSWFKGSVMWDHAW